VEHVQVIKAARGTNLIEQRGRVIIGAVLPKTLPSIFPETGAKSAGLQKITKSTGVSRSACPHF